LGIASDSNGSIAKLDELLLPAVCLCNDKIAWQPARGCKQARLITMLRAKRGASFDQMMSLTGWQAHTVRGTISRVLRKRLRLIVVCKSSTDSSKHLYRIVGSAVGV